ncbi:MAG: uracil-DNA glycosylase family protein [Gammaproteobacteria bacterium]|nr:uracil-DNA glycosylase family protein [Gammaproteobacteria bacterium]
MPTRRPESAALDRLLGQVHRCQLCRDLPLGPRPILQAASAARILIAGQAPGHRAHASGIPFDDPSGDRLRDWLGVDRGVFYNPAYFAILPMGFCYPGSRRGGDLPPRPECAPEWRSALLEHLPSIRLTLVIGVHAMRWHWPDTAPGTSVTRLVRDWRNYWPARLPMPHPSPRNNRWLKQNPHFEAEVLPALRRRVERLVRA